MLAPCLTEYILLPKKHERRLNITINYMQTAFNLTLYLKYLML